MTVLSAFQNTLSTLKMDKIKPYGVVTLVTIATLVIGLQLWTAYQTFSHQPDNTSQEHQTVNQQSANYNINDVIRNHLFGRSTSNNVQQDTRSLPTTGLNFVLRGAFTSSIADNASAMIQGPDGSTQYFKVGSTVFNRASLQAVHDDRVVLSRDEQLETLYFPLPGTDSPDQPLTSVNIPSNIQELVKDTMSLEEISQARQKLSNPKITPKQRQDLIKKRLQELRSRARQIKDNR